MRRRGREYVFHPQVDLSPQEVEETDENVCTEALVAKLFRL